MRKLLVATKNQGKVVEFAEMLSDLDIDWLGLDDLDITTDVDETGDTFRSNAILKAKAYARESGLLTIADDSGLIVDALGGAPGIYTARYGGNALSAVERYMLLLHNLRGQKNRAARFRCVIALVDEKGELLTEAEGTCEGEIAHHPTGSGGFGYDPVFYLPEYEKTMAEISSTLKHQISHRGKAMKLIAPKIRSILER